jgi:transcriptional regulator with XRE-family HTH domain
MISKNELGARLRMARKDAGMTLKELEAASGFSATHISEIERGKTSPTIGALLRIARALRRDTSFFLEEEQLAEVAVVRRGERQPLPEEVAMVRGEYLTPGIPGGRLNAYMVLLDAANAEEIEFPGHPGEEGLYVLEGEVEFRVGERRFRMKEGDAVHYPSDQVHGMRNLGQGGAQIIFVSTKRLRKHNTYAGSTGRTF